MKILIIEDERELSKSIQQYLRSEQYICEVALDYPAALNKIDQFEYDCVLLDISLPGGNGLSILKEIRANQKTEGIIIISAKDSIDDRINGLNLGADDYLPKPFHLSELSARVAAVLRRRKLDGNSVIRFHEISIDTNAKAIFVNNVPMEVTRKEYQLLLYFIVNKGKVISKNALVQHLWGDEMGNSYNFDFIYTHIKNLRKKMQEAGSGEYLKAVYGMGYKFTDA